MSQDLEYRVASGRGWSMDKAVEYLESDVRGAISTGWRPIGGVNAVAILEGEPPEVYYYCHQAVVRDGPSTEQHS